LPATVVIVLAGETRRMRWLLESAISTPPSGCTATPIGILSRADVAGPPSPENPLRRPPANVVIVPSDDTRRTSLLLRQVGRYVADDPLPTGQLKESSWHGTRLAQLPSGMMHRPCLTGCFQCQFG
jgi:hypothetical protein